MNHLPKFTVVLDACVLYPAPIRDVLLSLAAEGLFIVKWSDIIQNEWLSNLLANSTDLKKEQLIQTGKCKNISERFLSNKKHCSRNLCNFRYIPRSK